MRKLLRREGWFLDSGDLRVIFGEVERDICALGDSNIGGVETDDDILYKNSKITFRKIKG